MFEATILKTKHGVYRHQSKTFIITKNPQGVRIITIVNSQKALGVQSLRDKESFE